MSYLDHEMENHPPESRIYFQQEFLGLLENEINRSNQLKSNLIVTLFDTTNFPEAIIGNITRPGDVVGSFGNRMYGVIFSDIKEEEVLKIVRKIIKEAGNGVSGMAKKRDPSEVRETAQTLFDRARRALVAASLTNKTTAHK